MDEKYVPRPAFDAKAVAFMDKEIPVVDVEKPSDLWDTESSGSMVSLLPRVLAKHFTEAINNRPELFNKTEGELKKHFKEKFGRVPTATENQLRLKFWYEYEYARQSGQDRIDMARVVSGVCRINSLYGYVENKPETIAWICCMPMTYELHLDEMINFGSSLMADILREDAKNPETGELNIKLLELQFKIYMAAELRKFGAIPQTMKNINYNLTDPRSLKLINGERGEALLEKRIKEVEKDNRRQLRQMPQEKVNDTTDLDV